VTLISVARSPGLRLVARRLLHAIPVMWGVTFMTFALMNLLPGGAAAALAGEGATKADVQALAVRLHLNEPFFARYIHWLGGVVTGHLGQSLASGQAVSSILAARLPVTIELVGLAMLFSVSAAIVVAVLAVRKPHGIADRVSTVVCMCGLSIPGFALGLVLILIFAVHLRLVPALGFVPLSGGILANLRTMVLPSVTLAFALFSHYVRILRADMSDQFRGEAYVVTARAKGVRPYQVLLRHVLRNSLFGMLTVVGVNIGVLVGGTVLIEEIFALPGMGQALIEAVTDEDVVVVEAIVLVVSLAVVVCGLLIDLLYSVLDPRIRYGRTDS
jgi:peptide/nickel transport system permease protein